jgi:hypothetical protein
MTGNGYRVGQKIAAHTMSKGAAEGREFAAAKIVAGDIKSVNAWIATADAKRSWMLVNGSTCRPKQGKEYDVGFWNGVKAYGLECLEPLHRDLTEAYGILGERKSARVVEFVRDSEDDTVATATKRLIGLGFTVEGGSVVVG